MVNITDGDAIKLNKLKIYQHQMILSIKKHIGNCMTFIFCARLVILSYSPAGYIFYLFTFFCLHCFT